MATIAIGDIHGNLRSLEDLLGQLERSLGPRDSVVFLGDYIDRGPDTRKCVDAIIRFVQLSRSEVIALRGNHEDWMLRTYQDYTQHSWLFGMNAFETIRSYTSEGAVELWKEARKLGARLFTERISLPYHVFFDRVPDEHIKFFTALRTYVRTRDVVCVHGGLDPHGGPVEEQMTESIIWGGAGFPNEYTGSDHVVYGHANHPVLDGSGGVHPRVVGKTYGIDTISHGVLTAIRFPELQVFQSRRYEL